MPKLEFCEENHQYFLDTIPIPSVSEIISPIYEKVYKEIDSLSLKKAADKGTRVHRAIESMSKYNLTIFDDDKVLNS